MNKDKDIVTFIMAQTCASVCCMNGSNEPYCFSAYYAFSKEGMLLYFKSSPGSNHYEWLKINKQVAGTILPDKLKKLETVGIQFQGTVLEENDPLTQSATLRYHRTHPLAIAVKGEVFTIKLQSVKMTNSKAGFGKKIHWHRQEEEQVLPQK